MTDTTIISPLETFQKLFRATRLEVKDDGLYYRFRHWLTAKYFEDLAQDIILENKLRVTAELNTWHEGGFVFERCLVVKLVPEQYMIEHY